MLYLSHRRQGPAGKGNKGQGQMDHFYFALVGSIGLMALMASHAIYAMYLASQGRW